MERTMRRDEALAIIAAHAEELRAMGVVTVSLFGSVARDEARPDSDVYVLVEFDRPVGSFAILEVQRYLEKILGRPVDVGQPDSLRPHLREQVLREAIRVA